MNNKRTDGGGKSIPTHGALAGSGAGAPQRKGDAVAGVQKVQPLRRQRNSRSTVRPSGTTKSGTYHGGTSAAAGRAGTPPWGNACCTPRPPDPGAWRTSPDADGEGGNANAGRRHIPNGESRSVGSDRPGRRGTYGAPPPPPPPQPPNAPPTDPPPLILDELEWVDSKVRVRVSGCDRQIFPREAKISAREAKLAEAKISIGRGETHSRGRFI
jgi:hypothetical protein